MPSFGELQQVGVGAGQRLDLFAFARNKHFIQRRWPTHYATPPLPVRREAGGARSISSLPVGNAARTIYFRDPLGADSERALFLSASFKSIGTPCFVRRSVNASSHKIAAARPSRQKPKLIPKNTPRKRSAFPSSCAMAAMVMFRVGKANRGKPDLYQGPTTQPI